MLGEQSTVQALLGILTCTSWLVLVAVKFPYKVYWDNILEISLSFGLLMTLLSGFALQVFQLKEMDGHEQLAFDILLVLMLIGSLFAGLLALGATLPIPYVAKFLFRGGTITGRTYLEAWVKKHYILTKWLSTADLKGVMGSTERTLKK